MKSRLKKKTLAGVKEEDKDLIANQMIGKTYFGGQTALASINPGFRYAYGTISSCFLTYLQL
jgi:hypothetical protein